MKTKETYYTDPKWLIQSSTAYKDCQSNLLCENSRTLSYIPDTVNSAFRTRNGEWISLSNEGFMAFIYHTICVWMNLVSGEEIIEQMLNTPIKEAIALIGLICHVNIRQVEEHWLRDLSEGQIKNMKERTLAERGLKL